MVHTRVNIRPQTLISLLWVTDLARLQVSFPCITGSWPFLLHGPLSSLAEAAFIFE